MRSRLLLAAGAALVLQNCGGGGGGGGGSTHTGMSTVPVTTVATTVLGFAVQPVTGEDRNSQNALGPVNAFVPMINDNILGQGQILAEFDTGVLATHSDLTGQILSGLGYNIDTSQQQNIATDPDSDNHGTAVASLMVGIRGNGGMEGIAPGAQLVPFQFAEDSKGNLTDIDDAHLAPALNYLLTLPNVHVVNNSWNLSQDKNTGLSIQQYEAANHTTLASVFPNAIAAWQTFVNRGNVVVWASGNESAVEPDGMAGLPLEVPSLQPGWAVVVSITTTGTLSSFSNACGSTAAFCIAAVGSSVTVAVGPSVAVSGLATGSGTSFSAPTVSGAIAVLMSASPNITAQQALQILFQTANKTGAFADTATYGQGVMDLNKAMQPVGQAMVSAVSITAQPAATTIVATSSAFGGTLAGKLAAQSIVVQDDFQRGFVMPLAAHVVSIAPAMNADYRLAQFGRSDQPVYDDGTFRLELINEVDPWRQSPGDDANAVNQSFIGRFRPQPGMEFYAGAGINAGTDLGFTENSAAFDMARHALASSALANPYLSLIDRAVVSGLAVDFGALRLDVAGVEGQPFVPEGELAVLTQSAPRIFASDTGMSFEVADSLRLRFDAGAMSEEGSLLGAYGTGAAKLGTSTTEFAGLSGEWNFARGVSLIGDVYSGLTSEQGSDSLWKSTSGLGSFAAGIAFVADDVLQEGDRLLVGGNTPLRAVSGEALFALPNAVQLDGTVTTRPLRVGLKSDGQEHDLQAAYTRPLSEIMSLTGGVLLREEPDNVRDAAGQAMAAIRLDIKLK
jgi:subtilisin family serine protease